MLAAVGFACACFAKCYVAAAAADSLPVLTVSVLGLADTAAGIAGVGLAAVGIDAGAGAGAASEVCQGAGSPSVGCPDAWPSVAAGRIVGWAGRGSSSSGHRVAVSEWPRVHRGSSWRIDGECARCGRRGGSLVERARGSGQTCRMAWEESFGECRGS